MALLSYSKIADIVDGLVDKALTWTTTLDEIKTRVNSVTNAQLNTDVVGNGLQGANGSALSVKSDTVSVGTKTPVTVGANGCSVDADDLADDMTATGADAIAAIMTTPELSAMGTGCRVILTSDQAYNSPVVTAIDFDSEASPGFDDATWHNPASNPSRITVPSTGRYRITGQLEFYQDTGDERTFLLIYKNGVATYIRSYVESSSVGEHNQNMNISGTLDLTANDYIEAKVNVDDTGDIKAYYTWLEVIRIK